MSANQSIPIGSVVCLNSGGPRMTVVGERTTPSGSVVYEVVWFESGQLLANVAPAAALTMLSGSTGSSSLNNNTDLASQIDTMLDEAAR